MELVLSLYLLRVRALPMLCRLLLVSFGLAQGLLPAVLNARPALALRARVPAMLSPAQEKKASLVEEVIGANADVVAAVLRAERRHHGQRDEPAAPEVPGQRQDPVRQEHADPPRSTGLPDFEVVSKTGGELKFSNYWFFVPEEDMRATVKTWNDFIDESKRVCDPRAPPVRAHRSLSAPARRTRPRFRRRSRRSWAACSVATCSMPRALRLSSKLPTKQGLMGQVATLLTVLPTKLGRSLNAAGAQRLQEESKRRRARRWCGRSKRPRIRKSERINIEKGQFAASSTPCARDHTHDTAAAELPVER